MPRDAIENNVLLLHFLSGTGFYILKQYLSPNQKMTRKNISVDELIAASEKRGGYFMPGMTYEQKRAFIESMLDYLESIGVIAHDENE